MLPLAVRLNTFTSAGNTRTFGGAGGASAAQGPAMQQADSDRTAAIQRCLTDMVPPMHLGAFECVPSGRTYSLDIAILCLAGISGLDKACAASTTELLHHSPLIARADLLHLRFDPALDLGVHLFRPAA